MSSDEYKYQERIVCYGKADQYYTGYRGAAEARPNGRRALWRALAEASPQAGTAASEKNRAKKPLLEQDVRVFTKHGGPVAGHNALGAKAALDGACHKGSKRPARF